MEAIYSRLGQYQVLQRLSLDNLSGENGSLVGIRDRFSQIRGMRDFFDLNRMSRPLGFGDLQSRVSFNLRYFSSNYSIVLAALVVYALITNLLLLFVLVIAIGGFLAINSLHGADLVIPGGIIITQQSLYVALGIIVVPLFLFASPMATMFWLIGAAGVIIIGHAALLEKPIESEFAESV